MGYPNALKLSPLHSGSCHRDHHLQSEPEGHLHTRLRFDRPSAVRRRVLLNHIPLRFRSWASTKVSVKTGNLGITTTFSRDVFH